MNGNKNINCERGVIVPCSRGKASSEWSRWREYPHRFMPSMSRLH